MAWKSVARAALFLSLQPDGRLTEMSAIELRLLHVRSEHGYTANLNDAMEHEPEAVSEAEQRYQTRQARRRATDRELHRFRELRRQLEQGFAELRGLRVDCDLDSDVRVMQRQLDKIGRRIHQHAPTR